MPTSDTQWNYERLAARVGPTATLLLFYVLIGLPRVDTPAREFLHQIAQIEVKKVADCLNVSDRRARGLIQWLIGLGVLISRCPQDPWSLKALPEKFEKLPVLGATKRPGRPLKRVQAALTAPTTMAAYRRQSDPINSDSYPPPQGPAVREEQTKIAEMDFLDLPQVFALSDESRTNVAEGIRACTEARNGGLADAARVAEHFGHPDVRDAILRMTARMA